MEPDAQNWLAPLLQLGLGGAVLAWLMFQVMPRLKSVEMSIDRMSRAMLLNLVAQKPGPTIVEQAKGILNEIDQADQRRGGGT